MKRLKLGDAIGKGAFGVVFKALHLDTGKVYAVKQIKTSQMGSLELRDIMSEIDLLKNLYHDNIVSYQGFSQTVDHLNIIMEYCENGSLHSILQKFGNFPESLIALYVAQVLEGLEYLHGQDVIHRDIKAANILTTKSGTVKLADFGISSKLATGLSEHNSIMGSPFWMSPEIIQLEGAVKTSDIWSVGCTVIELLEGKPPYYSYDPMSVLFNIVQDNHPPFPETVISKDLHNFLKMCWIKDCSVRPSAEILLSHAWIQKSQHKQVTAKPKSATRMPSTPNRNEPNSQFIIPEPPGQLDWD
ncbi:kinase-like domain-containing protein [Obelidium mucronatum]|nr:kinase-like domain-containing protein [Obelidium mucronatum]